MQAAQTNEKIERRSRDEDLASYLDKLLRQESQPSGQVPSPVAQPQPEPEPVATVSTAQRERALPDERAAGTWPPQSSGGPAARKSPRWFKAVAPKRRKPASAQKLRPKPRGAQDRPKGMRQVVMKTLIPVLAVTLLVIVRRPFGGPAGAKADTPEVAPPAPVEVGAIEIEWQIPPAFQLASHDPMRLEPPQPAQELEPDATPVAAGETLEVKGVLYSEDRPAAIVGTRLVHEGEQVAGATVIAIGKDGVELERDGRRWRLTVSARPPVQETQQSREGGL
ncbi:MAG: hypothetical protein JW993_07425 [Sedimentisphaerales bacterium]|nr:hypothetical protein [Sedimentisphaerales bacterium]